MPIFIITLGVLAFSKIIFSATEVFFFFLGPFFAIIVALLVLLNARLEFFEDKIQIKRFLISRLRVENVSINKDSIAYGILSNNYRVKQSIMERSGLNIVPVSVLYLEYHELDKLLNIAINLSFFNNSSLRVEVKKIPQISIEGYGSTPSI